MNPLCILESYIELAIVLQPTSRRWSGDTNALRAEGFHYDAALRGHQPSWARGLPSIPGQHIPDECARSQRRSHGLHDDPNFDGHKKAHLSLKDSKQ